MLLYNLLGLPLKVGRKSFFSEGEGDPSMHGRLREQLKGNDSFFDRIQVTRLGGKCLQ